MIPKRFRREDWLNFGLMRLAEGGVDALRLTELCAAAQKTIGSFYHHFKDQSAFFEAMMAHWQKIHAVDIIQQIDTLPDADIQGQKLDVVARSMNQSVEVGVRVFASQNQIAAKVVANVDQMRIDYISGIYKRRLHLNDTDAQSLAELEYAAFVGTQMIWKGGTLEHGKSLSKLFQSMISSHYIKD